MILRSATSATNMAGLGCIFISLGAFCEFFAILESLGAANLIGQSAFPGVDYGLLLQSLPFHAVSLAMIGYPIYVGVGAAKVRHVTVSMENTAGLHRPFTLSIRVTPSRNLLLSSVKVKLEGRESATSGQGRKASTTWATFHDQSFNIMEQRQLVTDIPSDFTIDVSIPKDSMATFRSPHYKIEWRIHLSLELPGVNYSNSYELTVLPLLVEDSQ